MKNTSNIKYKSSASFLYQKFLSIDKRMRLNIVIGVSLVTIVVVTGVVLAMISLIQFGGSLIDDALGEGKQEVLKSFQNEKIQKNVEKIILHVDKTL
ncbi:hypothetical protein SHI21_03110 [Bacteriovorax sp. PP10]|uniref:Uncharacterized protein n=1 Tax=Bacteriovorax antarcticus TaxID=3088717 RepID=A0ABU5VS36_9BACT|nr:hypothetical protein [Bacteriovorax sp. PP10]MEA9355169.1 hypothetical protein [Bacteriovorax sp. PP10]